MGYQDWDCYVEISNLNDENISTVLDNRLKSRGILQSDKEEFKGPTQQNIERDKYLIIRDLDGNIRSRVFVTKNINDVAKFLSVFADKNLIPDHLITSGMAMSNMGTVKIEDSKMGTDCLFTRINERIDEKEKIGAQVSTDDFQVFALEELRQIENPTRRATITWDLIQELIKPEYFDPPTLINLCEQINQKNLPFFKEAAILKADLSVAEDDINITIEDRYIPSIESLLDIDDPEAQKMCTVFANAYIENGVPGNALNNLSVSKQSTLDPLKLVHNQNLTIKKLMELQAQLNEFNKQEIIRQPLGHTG